jgi:hypothetical protein
MRGEAGGSGALFSYVDLEDRVHWRHPLRLIRLIVNDVLADLSSDFATIYSRVDGALIDAWASMKSFRPRDDDGGA